MRYPSWAAGVAFLAFSLSPGTSHAVPVVIAGSDTVNVGAIFTIPISYASLRTDPDLISWQFNLSFSPTILQANAVTEGPFMSSFGTTLFSPGVIDNVNGLISLVTDAYVGLPPNPSGSGVLANIEFTALALGVSPLGLSNVFLTWDDQGFPPSFLVVDGMATVTAASPVPEPSTLSLLGGGLGAWSLYRGAVRCRRRCRAA